MSKIANANEKIAEKVVEGFTRVSDKCVEVLFAKDGETVEEAKKRLSGEKENN